MVEEGGYAPLPLMVSLLWPLPFEMLWFHLAPGTREHGEKGWRMPMPDLTFTLSNHWRYKSVSPLEDRSVGSSCERLEILNGVPEGFTVTQFSPVTGRAVCSHEGYSPPGPQFVYKMKYETPTTSCCVGKKINNEGRWHCPVHISVVSLSVPGAEWRPTMVWGHPHYKSYSQGNKSAMVKKISLDNWRWFRKHRTLPFILLSRGSVLVIGTED